MQYRDVIDMVIPRARRLGFVDQATGQVDAVEVETALLGYLQHVIARYDLDAFTRLRDESNVIATTSTGRRDYALPDDFGRLMQPQDRNEHGIFIHDGNNVHQLSYRDPQAWLRLQTTTNNRPSHFTIIGRDLHLDPPPDANNDSHYTIRGTYIVELDEIDLNADFPLTIAPAVDGTLAQMAQDMASPTASVLLPQAERSTGQLVAAQRRTRQPFQRKAQWSRNRGVRR